MSAVRARFLLPFAVAIALCACAKTEHAPAANDAPVSAWLAMARGQVDVEGGLVAIAASRDGRLDTVRVEDGDTVKQGDVLATLDARQARITLSIAQAGLAQARAQVDVLKAKLAPATQLAQRAGEAAAAGRAVHQRDDRLRAAAHLHIHIRQPALEAKAAAKRDCILFSARMRLDV